MFNCWERKKKPTKPQRNISMKFQNIRDKEKTLKTSRENEVTYERWGIRLASASPQQCWRQLSNAFQIWRENGNKDVFTQDSKTSLMHLLKQGRGPRKGIGNKARQTLKMLEMRTSNLPRLKQDNSDYRNKLSMENNKTLTLIGYLMCLSTVHSRINNIYIENEANKKAIINSIIFEET